MNAPETTTIANQSTDAIAEGILWSSGDTGCAETTSSRRHDRFGSVCLCPLAEPGERRTAEPFFSHQEGIELRQPFGSKQRSESAKRFSVAPLARGRDRQRGNRSDQKD
jgi:hypothetical protein